MDNCIIINDNIPSVRAKITEALPEGAQKDPKMAAALSLAFVGDTVYDRYVRTMLVGHEDARVNRLHLMSSRLVCAAGQAKAFRKIEPLLSEEELGVYKRGRNSHLGTVAKNASISDYRTATGLEALVGFLYLSGSDQRLTELMKIILDPNIPVPEKHEGTCTHETNCHESRPAPVNSSGANETAPIEEDQEG